MKYKRNIKNEIIKNVLYDSQTIVDEFKDFCADEEIEFNFKNFENYIDELLIWWNCIEDFENAYTITSQKNFFRFVNTYKKYILIECKPIINGGK